MRYPDLLETFQHADTTDMTGLITDSGHLWVPSGSAVPQVKDNALQRNDGAGSGYAFVDLFAPPDYQYADVLWTDNTVDGVVLISSRQDNSLTRMTHFYFGKDNLKIQMRGIGDGAPVTDDTINYLATVSENITYRVGVRFRGNRFSIDLPDGTTHEWGHREYGPVSGRYLCYQPLGAGVKISKVGCTVNGRGLGNG